jgi:hypothetical protein
LVYIFGYISPFLVYCTKKNLAILVVHGAADFVVLRLWRRKFLIFDIRAEREKLSPSKIGPHRRHETTFLDDPEMSENLKPFYIIIVCHRR